jgi:predicted ATPase
MVTKQELLKEVWAGVYMTKAVLKTCVQAIRKALGDDVTAPRYIQTVGREGYRFVGTGAESQQGELMPHPLRMATIVGREQALNQLERYFERVSRGERQLIFVTGEPGIGKTTLVDLWRERLQRQRRVWVGRGQCVEQYGEGEAYLPILEALADLAKGPGGMRLTESLRRYGPTWLVEIPALGSEAERQALQATIHGATRERRLREIVEVLEDLSRETPVVLLIEDLHWSDPSTVELLSAVAQRRQSARLCLLGTLRPAELVMGKHPLKGVKQELQAHGQCQEVRVELLSAHEVREYLARRFPQNSFPPELGTLIHRRTEGNALFMSNVVEELVGQTIVVQDNGQWRLTTDLAALAIPSTARQLIERQIERLSDDEQRILEAASVVGTEFPVASVAAALKREIDAIEDVCEGIVWQGHFLEEKGIAEWPDGTVSGHYSFRHALYQNVLYERIAEARQVRLHRAIGERLETGYGERAREVAAELAVHFERARDHQRTIQYLQQADENAARRSANVEAIVHLTKGLELLKTLPDTAERTQQELLLQIALGTPLIVTKGQAAPEVERVYARALELCQQLGETPQLFPVLHGLFRFYVGRAECLIAGKLAKQLLSLAQSVQDPGLLLAAHMALEFTLLLQGEFAPAREHLEQALALYDPQKHNPHISGAVGDPGVVCRTYGASVLWSLGYPGQAVKRNDEALTLAQGLCHPYSLAHALNFAAAFYGARREWHATQERVEAALVLCAEQRFTLHLATGTCLRGWVLAEQEQGEEGIVQICQGLSAFRAIGAEAGRTRYLAWLAKAYGKVRQPEKGFTVLAEALTAVDKTGERFYEAELYRLKGELTLQSKQVQDKSKISQSKSQRNRGQGADKSNPSQNKSEVRSPESEAEEYFLKALEIAQRQQAKSLELRATVSLARLWQRQGKKKPARQRLAEIYGWFTEGFDTKDLQEAKALLEELG